VSALASIHKPSSTRGFRDILGTSVALHGSNPRSSELVAVLASDVGTTITTKVPLNGLEQETILSRYLHRRVTEPPPHGFNYCKDWSRPCLGARSPLDIAYRNENDFQLRSLPARSGRQPGISSHRYQRRQTNKLCRTKFEPRARFSGPRSRL
jgi:hypothetical protein